MVIENQIKGKGGLPTFSTLDQKIFPTDTFIKHYRYYLHSVPISDGHHEDIVTQSHSDEVISSARVLTQACQKAISVQQSTRISYHWLTWKIIERGAI